MSNLTTRVIAGVVGIPILLAVTITGGKVFLGFTILLSVLALFEFYGMFIQKGYKPRRIPMIMFSTASIILFEFLQPEYYMSVLCIAFGFSAVSEIFKNENRDPMNIATDIMGIVYIGLPLSMLNDLANNHGMNMALYLFVLIWSCDSFAYFGGRLFGKTPLSPVSPNKTVEGSLTGLIFTAAVSIAFHFFFPESISLSDSVILGILIGLLSQAGDLFESMLKRYCGVKDSSNIIPGHGGVLDRFDSLMFAVPFAYIYLRYF